MLHLFSWIQLCLLFTTTLAKFDLSALKAWKLRREWELCCQKHLCLGNSCYITQRDPTGWSTARQRCLNQYPEKLDAVDIFQFEEEEALYTILKETHVPSSTKKLARKTVWTGGIRCPQSGPEGTVFVNQWITRDQPFPKWLEEKLRNTSINKNQQEEKCKFLSVSATADFSNVLYSFEDQNAHHMAICEFKLPGREDITTEYEITDPTTVKKITSNIIQETAESSTSTLTTASIKSKTLGPAEGKLGSVTSTKLEISEITSSAVAITTEYHAFCEGKEAFGLWWPNTKPGDTAKVNCSGGMIGYAEWKCDRETKEFTPKKPHVENCKHKWIHDLEEDVTNGRNDAVEISSKLAKETRNKSMSHGDITALVDLASKLLKLYFKQKKEDEHMYEEQQKPRPLNFTESMVASISNMLRSEVKQAWEVLPEKHQIREAAKILKIVTTIGSHLSCIRKTSDKLQFTVSKDNIDLQTFILNTTNDSDDDRIIFPQETKGVKTSSTISLPSNIELGRWLSPCKNYNSAVGVIYKHVGDFLKSEQLSDSATHVATKVISFSMSNNTEPIYLPRGKAVSIVLQHVAQQDIRHNLGNPRCVFWNFSKSSNGEWDRSGCLLVYSNETHTLCKCNHLTNFAVLMDINSNIKDNKVLSMMTYVCCGVSSLTLALTLMCFVFIRALRGRRSIITGNLCLSLLVTNVLLIFGLDQTQDKVLCAVIAGLLHFWVLSAFCWMLVEGYHLYRMVVLVFERSSKLSVKFYYIFAYGTPVIIVGISAGIEHRDYVGPFYCWLSARNGLMWSFVGPACVIILVNLVVFILTLRSASSVRVKREQSTMKKIKNWVKGSMSVMCLLGLTWSLGLFYIDKKLYDFSYIFTILNGLQGVFIFLFHVLLNDKVNKSFFCGCKRTERERRQKFLNQTSSNRLQSRTSNRTSVNSTGCPSANVSATNPRLLRYPALPQTSLTSKESEKSMPKTANSTSKKKHSIIYNKNKATHTISENGLPKPKYINHSKIRSSSLPEEKSKPIFHIKNVHLTNSTNFKHHGSDFDGRTGVHF